jgi:hypothetical protein
MPVKKMKTFDITKYQIKTEVETKTIKLPDGVEFDLQIQELTWKKRNQYLIAASSQDASGEVVFNCPEFAELCLMEMIKVAPWGTTTRSFFAQINSDLGDALTTLVPLPQQEEDSDGAAVVKK